jgi:hypothetical protein
MKTKEEAKKSRAGADVVSDRLRSAEGAVRSDCISCPDLSLRDIADPILQSPRQPTWRELDCAFCGNKARMSMKTKDQRRNQPPLPLLNPWRGIPGLPSSNEEGLGWCDFAPWLETAFTASKTGEQSENVYENKGSLRKRDYA